MDDIPMLGGSPPSGSYDATEAKYYKGLFKEEPWNTFPALTSAVVTFFLLFVFWPLAIMGVIVTGALVCGSKGDPKFRAGYAGRCPACNSTIRMEVKELNTQCLKCRKLIIRQKEQFQVLR